MNSATFRMSPRVCLWVRRAIPVLGLSLAVLLAAVPAFPQASTGRILGTVTDQSGAAIVGATVNVRNVDKGVTRTLTTNGAGEYVAPGLLAGTKTVRAEFAGFKTVERQNILLEVGGDVRVDFVLQPGAVTETITVTEAPPMVETTNAALGGTLSNQVINDLPLNGRNFENLLTLRPGVTIYPGGGGWTQSTNGIRAHDNVYLVDGVNSNDPWMAQSMMNAGAAAGDADNILPIDAIDMSRGSSARSSNKSVLGETPKPFAIATIVSRLGTFFERSTSPQKFPVMFPRSAAFSRLSFAAFRSLRTR